MRIAFMMYDGGPYIGGPLSNAVNLLTELKSRGHVVLALILSYKDESVSEPILTERGIEFKKFNFPQYRELLMKKTLTELKLFQPDVFIPNICFTGLFAAKYVMNAGIPCIAAHRSDDSRNWNIASVFGYGNEMRLSGLICVSEYLKNETLKRSKDRNINAIVIPSGVNVSPIGDKKINSVLKVVYSGRLVEEQKRVHKILDLFVTLSRHITDIECSFLGDGEELNALKNRVREARLESKIKFLGYQSGQAYQETLSKYDIIILCSDYEGTPGSLMDGMSLGLIPISSNFSGVNELIQTGVNGFIAKTTEDYLAAVLRIKTNVKERRRLSKNANAHIINNYSIDACTDLWESFCAKLVEGNKNIKKRDISIPKTFRLDRDSKLRGNEPPFPYSWFNYKLLRQTHLLFARQVRHFKRINCLF